MHRVAYIYANTRFTMELTMLDRGCAMKGPQPCPNFWQDCSRAPESSLQATSILVALTDSFDRHVFQA